MDGLLLHPKTSGKLHGLLAAQPHGVLITGTAGSGKKMLARAFAAELLGLEPAKLSDSPYYNQINPEGESITIEEIRSIQAFLKLKVPGKKAGISRVIIIVRAERMRAEAQNSLLKTLEEPPEDTSIIMTAESPEVLLPTITSRVMHLPILPVSKPDATNYFSIRGKKAADINRFYALSQGQVGLLHALLHEEAHPLLPQVELAKAILAEQPGKRMYRVDEIAKEKQNIRLLLNALGRISHAALIAASAKNDTKAAKRWHNTQEHVLQASQNLSRNVNTKLLLDNLFLNI